MGGIPRGLQGRIHPDRNCLIWPILGYKIKGMFSVKKKENHNKRAKSVRSELLFIPTGLMKAKENCHYQRFERVETKENNANLSGTFFYILIQYSC